MKTQFPQMANCKYRENYKIKIQSSYNFQTNTFNISEFMKSGELLT
jgi:hypothetical protein